VFPSSSLGSSPLLKTSEAAVHLGLAESTLEKMRVYGGGPKFVRPSRRAIRYRLDDLNQFLEEKVFGSTSEYAALVH
jgi:hypothetical protein